MTRAVRAVTDAAARPDILDTRAPMPDTGFGLETRAIARLRMAS